MNKIGLVLVLSCFSAAGCGDTELRPYVIDEGGAGGEDGGDGEGGGDGTAGAGGDDDDDSDADDEGDTTDD